jgi:hypothetical protein
MTGERKSLEIVAHDESCLERFGDTHRGVDWPQAEDVERRPTGSPTAS